ncbi:hypothetical protein M409DRAFT_56016 [Zasmidium cellare ATCC 36951]|uniref:DUF7820 domain-containing protein n=1 Tax=Zasmidium cellare ATCC 36951 TaxID=1080233 RepID=A0A6A6CI86_ZASCE|nr:uncharacterized protein M409DRAFT_56016 [Zasmidium cellare ATCC 36951]KAF2165126.1 hypothetical protein M409DRAFT_56016 [Zasmidium cellare ATCC 36951]
MNSKLSPGKLQSNNSYAWHDLSSSAPEVLADPVDKEYIASSGKEVAPSAEKQVASDDGIQVAPGLAPEVLSEVNLPEAIDQEDEKEAVNPDPDYSLGLEEKPIPSRAQWRRDHKVVLLLSAGTILLLVIAVALGAGLGVALNRKSENNSSASTVQSTNGVTLYDASQIASPTSTSLPTGTGALALSAARESAATCLTQRDQQVAWDCNLTPDSRLAIDIQQSSLSGSSLGAQVVYASDYTGIQYGAQAPYMNTTLGQFLTVIDNNDPEYGAAFYFQQTRGETASPGERLWLCVFNETLLEGFIYLNQSAHPASSTSSSSSTSAPATTSSHLQGQTAALTSSDSSNTASATPTPTTTRPNPWDSLPTFSRVVKLEERRIANNSVQPWCQKYQILDGGSANWVGDENGEPIIVRLEEDDSNTSGQGCRCQWMSGDGS